MTNAVAVHSDAAFSSITQEKAWKMKIPVPMAFAREGDKEKFLEGDCDAYIDKPISIPDFLQTVERFAERLVA